MIATVASLHVVHEVWLDIVDGPERPVPYSRNGRTYRVTSLMLKWAAGSSDDGWRLAWVQVHGLVLNKDGAMGKNPAKESFYEPRPDWVEDLAAKHWPRYEATS